MIQHLRVLEPELPDTDLAADPHLETRDLSVWYGTRQALRDVTITVPRGHVTALIGPSGCGKTTLLRCLNRMNDTIPGFHSQGSILLDGEDVNASSTDVIGMRRRVGMLFQRPNPFPMSIFENVAYGLKLERRMTRTELEPLVSAALERVGLLDDVRDRLDRSALGLSGGQQQRLCLARTLAVQPEVILMDEPCSALDPIATERIEKLIRSLRGEVTTVIVTHNLQQAARVSDQVAFMMVGDDRVGEMIESGPTSAVFAHPKDARTEAYVEGRFG